MTDTPAGSEFDDEGGVSTFGRKECSSSGFVGPVNQEVPKLNEVPLDVICAGRWYNGLHNTRLHTHTHTHTHNAMAMGCTCVQIRG